MESERTLLDSIVIEALIPENGTAQLSDLFEDVSFNDPGQELGFVDIKIRDLLFTDERVRAVCFLQITHAEEGELKSLLKRAEFSVEAWALDNSSGEDQNNASSEPTKDLIYSTTVKDVGDPIVLAQQSETDGDLLTLAWEVDLVLHRPRLRMQDPCVCIQSTLTVSASNVGNDGSEDYLAPFKPLEPNIFEPMRNMPGFENRPPYLASSRLERVRPPTPKSKEQFRAERTSSPYKIVPAVITRMRYHRMSTPSPLPTLIASLDLEVIPLIEIVGSIEESVVTLASGMVEDLMPEALPLDCRSRDWISLLFRLHPSRNPVAVASPVTPGALSNMDVLSMSLVVRLRFSETCRPLIRMAFTTNVDFFQALNPSFGAPSQPIQRVHRPSSLALGNGNGRSSQSISTSLQPGLNPAPTIGVSISFTAPDHPVEVGKVFVWNVIVVNGSARPTKLAVIPLPRIPRGGPQTSHFAKRHAPKSSTASFQQAERRHAPINEPDVDFAQAVIDENVVYAIQHSNAATAGTDLMALTAELRIGPLAPGQCHESVIEMVAFAPGTLRVDAVRVIDLVREAEEGVAAAGVMVDIRDLPDVVVVASEKVE